MHQSNYSIVSHELKISNEFGSERTSQMKSHSCWWWAWNAEFAHESVADGIEHSSCMLFASFFTIALLAFYNLHRRNPHTLIAQCRTAVAFPAPAKSKMNKRSSKSVVVFGPDPNANFTLSYTVNVLSNQEFDFWPFYTSYHNWSDIHLTLGRNSLSTCKHEPFSEFTELSRTSCGPSKTA